MFGKKENPKSIDLLQSVDNPSNIWGHAYQWMFEVGKYMLIVVEILVLGVFMSRFVLDRKRNKLTEDINDQVTLLSGSSWQQDSITYENIQTLLVDVNKVSQEQPINSIIINEVRDGIPNALQVLSFSFSNKKVRLNLETTNFKAFKDYESALKNNENYQGVTFKVTKNDTVYDITVNFSVSEISG